MVVGLITTLKPKRGAEREFEYRFGHFQEAVRKEEKGYVFFDFFAARGKEPTYVAVAGFASEEALSAHFNAPHTRLFMSVIWDLLAREPDVQVLDKLS